MNRYTEEMKDYLFDLAHGNLDQQQVVKGFIKHYVLFDFGIGNVQQDILFHSTYGEQGVKTAVDILNAALQSFVSNPVKQLNDDEKNFGSKKAFHLDDINGQNIMDPVRFKKDTRHMIIFEVTSNSSLIGNKRDQMRLFLTDKGYDKAKSSQERAEIDILEHAEVRAGCLHYEQQNTMLLIR